MIWIDLAPKNKTNTQKFVIRVVTQSHPWGYQRTDNNIILTVSDRKSALNIFREIPENKKGNHTELSLLKVFPYDADVPVPLPFLIKSISLNGEQWKMALIQFCKEHLPCDYIKTKNESPSSKNYLDRLHETLYSIDFNTTIFNAINELQDIKIPGITIKKEILSAEDDETADDPTLFVRLNSSGTRLEGEELIYSIYKASFPEAKQLVENIGASFVSPSRVITLVCRLAFSEINENQYPGKFSINDFRKRIKEEIFKNKLKELIGHEDKSPAKQIFAKLFNLLLSPVDFDVPPIIVKNILKNSPDLFLLLLQWIRLNDVEVNSSIRRKILAIITSLSWFSNDNEKYVKFVWKNIKSAKFWDKEELELSLTDKERFIINFPIPPTILRTYLIEKVVQNKCNWPDLLKKPEHESDIIKSYKKILYYKDIENKFSENISDTWYNFMNRLFWNKALILFAQRHYINKYFGEFNQMDNLEDSNTPWDWDHIYSKSYVVGKWNVHYNTRWWNNSIGNLRALSLEQNRSENNNLFPKARLENSKKDSFIMEEDWKYWSQIINKINPNNEETSDNHLKAIINRLCNIYEEWYSTLKLEEFFE